ncbi:BTB/POZ domain-containing protein 1-like isoform X2 [Rhodnius prolixus]|uniref:BTB/POZ domain-containing protein 1-like isoform X2 n=1 Tax=Rhodnius prolixus TaxID=13249 RepID=UPI003D18B9C5
MSSQRRYELKKQIIKEIKAHKLILSMASPVFEKMFQNGLNRCEDDVELTDIQPDVFDAVLNYIYTEEIKIVSFDGACEIYYVAHKYMLPELMEQCKSYLSYNANSSNACYGFELAKLFNITELKALCKTIITSETINVVKDESFKAINISTLKMILKENSLNITELELFKAVERWIVANVDMKKNCDGNHLAELSAEIMPLVCFLKMTPKEFVEGPAVSNLLSKDEAYAVLINIISPENCKIPLPNGFSNMLRKKPVQKLETNVQMPFTFSSGATIPPNIVSPKLFVK